MSELLKLAAEVDFGDRQAYGAAAPRIVDALVADGLAVRVHDEAVRITPAGRLVLDLLKRVAQLERRQLTYTFRLLPDRFEKVRADLRAMGGGAS